MRIAFVSDVNPYDRAAFSGSTYQILQIILATGATVEVVGPVMEKWRFNAIRLSSVPYRLAGQGVAWPKHPFLLRSCAQKVDEAARRIKPDVIFSAGSNSIAYSNFLRPTIFWSDAPFGAMMDYYPWPQFQRLTEESRRYGLEADTRALRYSTAGIFRSNWARDAAIQLHHADPSRVHVVPLPGNLFRRWSLAEIQQAVPRRLKSPWKIFFSGVDWVRKGGDRTVAIINELVRLGQPCELYVAGVVAPVEAVAAAQFPILSLGRLNLNDPAKRELLGNVLQESTFLVVPSTAEALALVYCEALGAGVPSLGTATGGVSDAILDGKTGFLIAPNEPPGVTAKRMLGAGQPAIYAAMAEASWHEWHLRFAMQAVLAKLTQILEKTDAAGRFGGSEPRPLALSH
jgi:glycosyltransferase involved in cell wall biosynthesis